MPQLVQGLVEDAARVDQDRTLATSFLIAGARERVISLILFNHELARARAVVSDAGLAAIRLQWWRDTLDQIYAGKQIPAHPIAAALAQTVREAALPQATFEAMIRGYEQELESYPFQTWTDVEAYLDATKGNLNRLCLLASGQNTLTTALDGAAKQAGIATGLAETLRDAPIWLMRRCINLPLDQLLTQEYEPMFAGEVSVALKVLLGEFDGRIARAQSACNNALKLASASASDSFPVLGAATLARGKAKSYLPKAGKAWQAKGEPTLLWRQIKLTVAVARGRI
jgi:phytoene/squalene synthetase